MPTHYIVLDTETTGLHKESRVIEIGMKVYDEKMNLLQDISNLCNPDVDIQPEASAIHNIYKDDIKNELPIQKTSSYKLYNEMNHKNNTLVIHNSWFDLYMLYKEDFPMWKGAVIDTLICSRHVYKDLPSYKLSNLICDSYQSHRVLEDCQLAATLLRKMFETETRDNLIQFTSNPIIGFGMHRGKLFKDLDTNYMEYITNNYTRIDTPTALYMRKLLKSPFSDDESKLFTYLFTHNIS